MWLPDIQSRSGPRYLAIADVIVERIAAGQLRPGDRLPTQREFARDLGVSLNTISRAYAEIMRRGFLDGEVGRGTFVRASAKHAPAAIPASLQRPRSGPIDFSLNLPFAGSADSALAATLSELSQSAELAQFVHHQPKSERSRHSDVAATWIERLGLPAAGRSVVLSNGAQHGLLTTLMAFLKPGDVLLVEELTYAPILAMARQLGVRLWPVAIDDDGIVPDALAAACKATAATVLYTLPTLHTPTAITMSEPRRLEIAAIVESRGLTVIEDDVFGFLPTERPNPLACFAPEHTIYLTGVSKSLAPGLRVGYLSAPDHLAGPLNYAIALSSWMPPPLMAEIATRWIEAGVADRLSQEQRDEAMARQALARDILSGQNIRVPSSGYHLWLSLPDGWRSDDFWAAAKRSGVEIQPATAFAVDRDTAPNAVRICLSHELTRDRVVEGLEIIARLLTSPIDEQLLVV
jgi:DNA-binding transcriptional MocR family regulator